MQNIYLVGFMGTGKTAVGRLLARRLKRKFFDLDDLIEEEERMSIPDIFAKKGEPYFRSAEKRVLFKVSLQDNLIIACGGGIVIDEENIDCMKKTGKIICLSASADVILKRTSKYTHRPLLNVVNPKEKIEELLKQRAAYYASADIAIDATRLSVAESAEAIIAALAARV